MIILPVITLFVFCSQTIAGPVFAPHATGSNVVRSDDHNLNKESAFNLSAALNARASVYGQFLKRFPNDSDYADPSIDPDGKAGHQQIQDLSDNAQSILKFMTQTFNVTDPLPTFTDSALSTDGTLSTDVHAFDLRFELLNVEQFANGIAMSLSEVTDPKLLQVIFLVLNTISQSQGILQVFGGGQVFAQGPFTFDRALLFLNSTNSIKTNVSSSIIGDFSFDSDIGLDPGTSATLTVSSNPGNVSACFVEFVTDRGVISVSLSPVNGSDEQFSFNVPSTLDPQPHTFAFVTSGPNGGDLGISFIDINPPKN